MLPASAWRGRDGAMLLLLTTWALCSSATGRQFSDREYHELPRLYHLDDFDRCLSRPNALYCTGTFQLSAHKSSRIYDLIQEYSSEKMHFNRKVLNRGFCVSERCPSSEINSTWRFERCVQQETQALGLTATLTEYHCHSSTTAPQAMDPYQRTFLAVVAVMLCLNFVGTMYDFATGSNGKSKLLLAWSVRGNWRRLVASYEDGDPRLSALAPLQGVRVILLLIVMKTHTVQIIHFLYLNNPNFFEKAYDNPFAIIMKNGSGIIQYFIAMGTFLFGYNLLLYSKKVPIGLSKFSTTIVNRIFRLAPVHMLVVGFAATWWEQFGSGPQWASVVGAEAAVCRRKLPLHAAFVHNLVQPEDHCLLQTWFIAVDFQLHAVASLVMLTLMQFKWRPLPILTALFLLSCLVNLGLAHYFQWKSLLYMTTPENMKSIFHGEPSFSRFYTAPWGSLPSALLGLLTAHLHFHIQETGYKLAKCKVFVWLYHLAVPLSCALIGVGNILKDYTSPTFITMYMGVERPLFGLLGMLFVLGFANNIEDPLQRVFAWRGWSVLGRLSLAVLTLHWCVIKALLASRQTLTETSFFYISMDITGVWFWTYVLAIPVTILVEYPVLRTGTALVS